MTVQLLVLYSTRFLLTKLLISMLRSLYNKLNVQYAFEYHTKLCAIHSNICAATEFILMIYQLTTLYYFHVEDL